MSHVTVDRTKPWAQIYAEWIGEVVACRLKGHQIRLVMESLTGGGATPALLESGDGAANFGVPAGGGASVYNNTVSIDTALTAISPTMLADMDQGQ